MSKQVRHKTNIHPIIPSDEIWKIEKAVTRQPRLKSLQQKCCNSKHSTENHPTRWHTRTRWGHARKCKM